MIRRALTLGQPPLTRGIRVIQLRTLHLPEPYAAQVRALLQQHIPEAGVWAYGSRVRGDHYPASDLDLVVCFPSDSPRRPPKVLHLWPPKLPVSYTHLTLPTICSV